MYCLKCGKEISEGVAFCQHCGSPLNTSTKTATSDSIKNTADSFIRSFQEKAKSVSESINAAMEVSPKERFITKSTGAKINGKIIVDRFTGVNYLLASLGMSDVSGMTVLVDENGKPLVTKEDKIEITEDK